MIEFVFMLTHHDRTVPEPLRILEQVSGCGLRYVGFKDVGADVAELREVCTRAHESGMEVMLEVVSTSRDDELRSVAAAGEIGVDWLLGGTHAADALKVLSGGGADLMPRYCPFPGKIVGHPSVLLGDVEEIVRSARDLAAIQGVFGLDLLAYRHPSADAAELTRRVVDAVSGPVIAAGSVTSVRQIQALDGAGAWGFTIGGAIFEGLLPGAPAIEEQIKEVLRATVGQGQAGE